ncbi:MAG: 16S rRNA (cytosine(967)-C(5))-methyltransferase RsmB [Rugosibacter sp.]|nr:16S rRNA (cytosine(967)-C(5))-methyltransferase RsmB [Rugosibacter sp.]
MNSSPPQVAAQPAHTSATLAPALSGAAKIITTVLTGRTLDAALADPIIAGELSGTLRAAVMDLAYATLRSFGRGDFFLAQLMTKPVADVHIRCLLLVALARLEARPEQAYVIVDQAATAAAGIAAGNYKGLVNGVLRNFLRQKDSLLTRAKINLAAHWQHPDWWITRVKKDHPQHWQAILAANNTHPPMTLRVNCRRVTSADFSDQLNAAGLQAHAEGSVGWRLEKPLPVAQIPGFAQGLCSVQDAGAQRAAQLLDVSAGQRVLDACAAPGGKAAHLLESADIHLLALDSDPVRTARIAENVSRLGLKADNIVIRTGDAALPGTWWDGQPFDRILADVPCSASGVVRRHPDAKWLRRATDIEGFVRTQARIIDALWQTLAPGGKMLYATCSVFNAENDAQVAAFISRHSNARRLPINAAPFMQLLPTADHDGFFYALLQKI